MRSIGKKREGGRIEEKKRERKKKGAGGRRKRMSLPNVGMLVPSLVATYSTYIDVGVACQFIGWATYSSCAGAAC
jgi:hypothetical protein